jgi:hypothetical protein
MRALRRSGVRPHAVVADDHPGPTPEAFSAHVMGTFGEALLRRLYPDHFKEIER